MKPDFVCIGAQKAGTTWLYHQLNNHPEFRLPPIKEIHYFDRDVSYYSANTLSKTRLKDRIYELNWFARTFYRVVGSTCIGDFAGARWHWRWQASDYTDQWYVSLFDYARGKLTGDITPDYSILRDESIAHMRQVVGDAKIIFLLRCPIERAWSNLRHNQKYGLQLDPSDLPAVFANIDHTSQVSRNEYEKTLDRYLQHFEKSQIIIGYYDAIEAQPSELLTAILRHIGAKDLRSNKELAAAKFNVSAAVAMPEPVRDYLVKKYRPQIQSLHNRFGGYASFWLSRLDDPTVQLPQQLPDPVALL